MNRDTFKPYDLAKISHVSGVDHNESISVGPKSEAYTTGFNTCRVFKIDLDTNTAKSFASTGKRRVLGTGKFSPILASFISEVAEVVAICDPSVTSRSIRLSSF